MYNTVDVLYQCPDCGDHRTIRNIYPPHAPLLQPICDLHDQIVTMRFVEVME